MKHDKTKSIKFRLFLLIKRLLFTFRKAPKNSKQTVFISGMQRSGTNMLMKIIDYSSQTDVYHESDERAFDNFEMRDLKVIQGLWNFSPAQIFVIKTLCELQDISNLMKELQPAKTIWIVRDYNDVTNSMLASFRKNIVPRIVRVVKQESDEWLARGISEETKQKLAHCVHSDMSEASAAAVQWYFRNILFFEQKLEADKRVLLVSYEQLVSEPVKEIQRICRFLEIDYKKRMSDEIFSSSISKRNKPLISTEVDKLCKQLTSRFEQIYG